MKLINSSIKDIPLIMQIIADAQKLLADLEIDQWQDGYPNKEQILLDIKNEDSYIILNEDQTIVATTVFSTKTEPTYAAIEGEWLTPTDSVYGVIHRLAVGANYRGQGIAKFVLNHSEAQLKQMGIKSMRIDTHRDNKGMQQLITGLGYMYCGIIYVRDGSERLAFEKVF